MPYFKVFSQHLPEATDESHKNHNQDSWQRYEPGTYQI
jgi:hypothetical protein